MTQSLIEYDPSDYRDDSAFLSLMLVEREFVIAYAQTLDYEAACRAAGLDPRLNRGWMRKTHIRRAITDVLETQPVTPQEVVATVTSIMRSDIGDFLDVKEDDEGIEHVRFNLIKALKTHRTGVIKSIEIDKKGKTKITFYDKLEAAKLVGKYFGLFPDQLETKDTTDWKERARAQGMNVDEVKAEMKRILEADSIPRVIDGVATEIPNPTILHDSHSSQDG